MNDVPLTKSNSVNDINTSLIAIKKQLKQLNEALGLVGSPDFSPYVKKTELENYLRKNEVTDAVEYGNKNPVSSDGVFNYKTDVIEKDNLNPVTSNAVAEALSYSTDEIDTGAKWIDGKTIYRKTIEWGSLPSSTSTTNKAHNISNIEKVIKTSGYASSGSDFIPLPFVHPYTSFAIGIWADRTYISVNCGTDRSPYTGYITLEYTKPS